MSDCPYTKICVFFTYVVFRTCTIKFFLFTITYYYCAQGFTVQAAFISDFIKEAVLCKQLYMCDKSKL